MKHRNTDPSSNRNKRNTSKLLAAAASAALLLAGCSLGSDEAPRATKTELSADATPEQRREVLATETRTAAVELAERIVDLTEKGGERKYRMTEQYGNTPEVAISVRIASDLQSRDGEFKEGQYNFRAVMGTDKNGRPDPSKVSDVMLAVGPYDQTLPPDEIRTTYSFLRIFKDAHSAGDWGVISDAEAIRGSYSTKLNIDPKLIAPVPMTLDVIRGAEIQGQQIYQAASEAAPITPSTVVYN